MPVSNLSIPTFFGVLALLVVAAHAGGFVATRARLPSVVGELGVGIALAAMPIAALRGLRNEVLPNQAAELGVLLLLFDIGLELHTSDFRSLGWSALKVAIIGIVASLAFASGMSAFLGASAGLRGHVFVGATLAATSIGISGRVLRDLGRTQTGEGKLVLAAAVLDDVLSLLILAAVSAWVGASAHGNGDATPSMWVLAARAIAFLLLALLVGRIVLPRLFTALGRVAGEGTLLVVGLAICLVYAWAANAAGLAPAIGAFVAGLVIEPEDYRPLIRRPGDTLVDLLSPMITFFVPLFFVLAGLKVDVAVFLQPRVWLLTAALFVAAVLGKLLAGVSATSSGSRLVIGISLVPRGEVSLIFATAGAALTTEGNALVPPATLNALLATIVLTALVPPFALRMILARRASKLRPEAAS